MKNNYHYEVWALGYDKEGICTDVEEFLGSFDSKEDAVNHAKKFKDISYIYDEDIINDYLEDGDYFEILVETIKNSDTCSTNIESIYSEFIYMPEK